MSVFFLFSCHPPSDSLLWAYFLSYNALTFACNSGEVSFVLNPVVGLSM